MASRSLGTLTLDLIAKVGGFTGPLDEASRQTKSKTAEIGQALSGLAKGAGVALAALPAALAGLVVHTADTAKEVSNLAELSGLSTTEFQKYAAAAASVGVEQDKLSDIFKDTNDKIGDYFNTGGGAMKDFFDQIAPKVGVTADQFKKLNSAEALQLYVSSLEKANASQAEMTFYMEAIASDSTALIPLLRNGGKEFKELGDAAEAAGAILDVKTIAVSKEFSSELIQLTQHLDGAKNTVAEGLMPVVAALTKDLNESIKSTGGLNTKVKDLGETLLEVTAFTVSAADGVTRVVKIVADTLIGIYSTAAHYMSTLMSKVALGLSQLTLGDVSAQFLADSKRLSEEAAGYFNVAGQAAGSIQEELDAPMLGERWKQKVAEAHKAAAELAKLNDGKPKGGEGTGNDVAASEAAKKKAEEAAKAAAAAAKKLASEQEAAAKRINDAFASTETDYLRQVELIKAISDTQKEATEADKLRFEIASGKLVGINAEQQKRLEGLAEELDKLEKRKKLKEEDKEVAGFKSSVEHQLTIDQRGLDIPLMNAYDTEGMKQRAMAMLGIEQSYQDQLEDLRQRRQADEISESAYKRETDILNDALAKRLAMQEKYYDDVDKLQQNGTAGFVSGFATQAEASMDLYSNMQQAGGQAFNALTDAMSEWAATGELDAEKLAASFIGAIGNSLLSFAAAQVAMAGLNAFVAMIGTPFVGPAIAPGAAIAAAAAAGVLMTAVGSSLQGQAHAGIENIPREGTWLLDGGERVLSPAQNRDLTGYLNRANAVNAAADGGAPGGRGDTIIHNYGTQVETRREGNDLHVFVREAKRQIAGDIARGNGDITKALIAGYGMKRRAS